MWKYGRRIWRGSSGTRRFVFVLVVVPLAVACFRLRVWGLCGNRWWGGTGKGRGLGEGLEKYKKRWMREEYWKDMFQFSGVDFCCVSYLLLFGWHQTCMKKLPVVSNPNHYHSPTRLTVTFVETSFSTKSLHQKHPKKWHFGKPISSAPWWKLGLPVRRWIR